MTAQLSRERLEALANLQSLECMALPASHAESAEMARMLLAGLDSKPVAYFYPGDETEWQGVALAEELDDEQKARCIPLYAAAPAPVSVPDEQHSERFEWSYEDWANHLGGRHQNNDPACYYEFGSFMAVAEMLRQFGNVQRKIGWNVCRAAMLKSGPVTAATVPDGWTANADANDALVMLDRIDTVDCDDDERIESVKSIIRRLAAGPAVSNCRENENSSTNDFRENSKTSTKSHEKCWCHTCRPVTITDMRFVVCPDCGNKRCPRANDHRNACSGSNEPGQVGSAYPAAPDSIMVTYKVKQVSSNEPLISATICPVCHGETKSMPFSEIKYCPFCNPDYPQKNSVMNCGSKK